MSFSIFREHFQKITYLNYRCSSQERCMNCAKIKILGLTLLAWSLGSWAHAQTIPVPKGKTPNFTAQVAPQSPGSPAKPKIEFAPHRIIVKFKNQPIVNSDGLQAAENAAESLNQKAISALSAIQGNIVKSFSNIGAHVVQTPLAAGKAIEMLYRSDAVQYAEPDYKVRAIATRPNDPQFSELWGLNNTGQEFGSTPDADIDAPEAWAIRTDASQVIVAVVDTGVDYTHQDLSANMWKNPKEIPGNGVDDDGNGWIDDIYGIDTCNDDADPADDNSHGTHVSGTIGAKGNNGIGVTGVAWKAKIMALKFLCGDGFGFTSDAIDAINYALVTKSNHNYSRMILSNSWGGGGYSQALFDTISIAKGLGVLFVAAAGNEFLNTDNSIVYPAGYNVDNIISVGATDASDDQAWFSNYGCSSVDVFAPGNNILSTTPDDNYDYFSGTSMATPHITGIAALAWANSPGKNWRSVKSAVMNSVDQPASMSRLSVSQGRANLHKALQAGAMTEPTIWKISPSSAIPGDTITITGHNFGTATGKVDFNGTSLTVQSWSNTVIRAKLATSNLGAGTLKVIPASKNASDVGACFEVSFKPSVVGQTLIPRGWASSARVGGKLWVMGGEAPWGITGTVESVALSNFVSTMSSQWTMPIPLSNTGSAAIGSKIYVIGGYHPYTGTISDSVQIFDTVSKTWSSGAPLPQPLLQAAIVSVNGKLYVFGGSNLSSILSTTYIYDPVDDNWSSGTAKPSPAAFATATVSASDTKVTVTGGFSCDFYGCEQNIAEIYDTASDTWTAMVNLKQSRAGAAGAFYKGKHHTLFGATLRSSGEYFNGSKWVEAISGPALYTATATACSSCNAIVILTGYDQSVFNFSSNIWSLKE